MFIHTNRPSPCLSGEGGRRRGKNLKKAGYSGKPLTLPIQERLLHFSDGAGDIDIARAGFHTVEDRAAAPDAIRRPQDAQAVFCPLIPAVEDKAVGINNCRGADVVGVRPEGWTRRGARSAKDAFRGVVVALAIFGRLEPFFLRLGRMSNEV